MKKLLLLALCGIFLFGVSKAFADDLRIDWTNDKTYMISVDKISASLSKDKQEEFSQAVDIIAAHVQGITKGRNDVEWRENFTKKLKTYMDGKTADQIIAQAKQFQAEKDKK